MATVQKSGHRYNFRDRKNPRQVLPGEARQYEVRYTDENFPIRTLQMSLPPTIRNSTLFSHFAKYGELEYGRRYTRTTDSFVTFKRAEDASRALSQKSHRISNKIVEVKTGEYWRQLDAPVLRSHNSIDEDQSDQPDCKRRKRNNDANSNGQLLKNGIHSAELSPLLHLNDDCLMEIFRLLPPLDLISIAETCTRFKSIAMTVFASAHRNEVIEFDRLFGTSAPMYQIRRFLSIFGSLITNLRIDSFQFPFTFDPISLIVKYCSGTLESLQLERFLFDTTMITEMQPLFRHLKKLKVQRCIFDFASSAGLLSSCNQLVKLTLCENKNLNPKAFDSKCPQLESFTFSVCLGDGRIDLASFLTNHEQLKKFSLGEYKGNYATLIPIIWTHLKQLQVLYLPMVINSWPDNLVPLSDHVDQLKYLRKLKFNCYFADVSIFLNGLASIESIEFLHLAHPIIDAGLMDSISKMKNLRELQIQKSCGHKIDLFKALEKHTKLAKLAFFYCDGVNNENVINLVAKLNKLEELKYDMGESASRNFYDKIVDICRKRVDKIKLVIKMPYVTEAIHDREQTNKDYVELRNL